MKLLNNKDLLNLSLTAFLTLSLLISALSLSSIRSLDSEARGKPVGGKNTACKTGSENVTVSPNPVALGSTSFNFSGSGFCSNMTVLLDVPGKCCIQTTKTSSSGTFSYIFPFDARHAGITNTAAVWNANMSTLLGYTYFTVQ